MGPRLRGARQSVQSIRPSVSLRLVIRLAHVVKLVDLSRHHLLSSLDACLAPPAATTTAPGAEPEQSPRASDPAVVTRADLAASSGTGDSSGTSTDGDGVRVGKRTLLSADLGPRCAAGEHHGAEVAAREIGGDAKGSGVEAEGHHLGGGLKCETHGVVVG